MTEIMKTHSNLSDRIQTYPGYPTERLFMAECFFGSDRRIKIPDGPWSASNDELPTSYETKAFCKAGYTVDSAGRPLHPQWEQILSDKSRGAITGKGKYYYWGPNYTADPIVIAGGDRRQVLLIKRHDTGEWALPGGFVDNGEKAIDTASRELGEEAGLTNIGKPSAQIYKGVVSDLRTTLHSWAETTAYLWNLETTNEVCAGDDADEAAWFFEDNLPQNLHGSHAEIIKLALDYQNPTKLSEILSQPSELLTISPAIGGHMAYCHLLVDGPNDRLFVKAYDPKQFTDDVRRQHSLEYLHKENSVLGYLSENRYTYIPNRFELIDHKLIAMDAFRSDEGWNWRVPKSKIQKKQYISDVLIALEKLHSIPLPLTDISRNVASTCQVLQQEGWSSINMHSLLKIRQRVDQLSKKFDKRLQSITIDLLDNLDDMRSTAQPMKLPQYLVLSHNDARQANIAWHPDLGVKLVDWSWADAAPEFADSTMFLIDLAKSGVDVTPYLEKYFDKKYALTLIGFWLAHSILPTHNGSDTVRMQQVASATESYNLINNRLGLNYQPAK